jgi:hypothetical protein
MKGTRKQKKESLTIPQLRKAFDHIEMFTQNLIHHMKDAKERRKAFQEEWQKVFKRAVDDSAADAYILFESKKGKSKTRKMKGGAAPLDSYTSPGMYGVYGIFPKYISNGFATEGNATNLMGIQENCNGPSAFQPPYTGFGAASLAGQKGGKRSRRNRKQKKRGTRRLSGGGVMDNLSNFAQALSYRPITSSVPPSAAHDAQMMFKGAPVASPQPLANTASPPYMPYKVGTIDTNAGKISRDLYSEIQ